MRVIRKCALARRVKAAWCCPAVVQMCGPLAGSAVQKRLPREILGWCATAKSPLRLLNLRSDGKWQQNWQDDLTRKIIQLATF